MEDAYPSWGKLLPGLLADDVPAHLWLREKTGRDLNLWQYWEENPALEEQLSKAMTSWDNMVHSFTDTDVLSPFRGCRLYCLGSLDNMLRCGSAVRHHLHCRSVCTVCGACPAEMTRIRKADPSFGTGPQTLKHARTLPRPQTLMPSLWRQGKMPAITDFDWNKFNRVLDIGGAYGSMLAAVLEENSAAQGVLFELPQASLPSARVTVMSSIASLLAV
jgi:hypothetical protein